MKPIFPYIDYFTMVCYEYAGLHTTREMHTFKRPCIGYVLEGTGEFLYKNKTYRARAGDLLYIARGTEYFSVWRGEPTIRFYSISFHYTKQLDRDGYRFQIVRDFPRSALDDIYAQYLSGSARCLGLLYLFLDDMYKRLEPNGKSHAYDIILPAVTALETRYAEKWRVEKLAALCSLSPSRFYTVFKAVTGSTPIEYKNAMRVQRAIAYLQDTDLSVEAIAERLGFCSAAHFRKQLRMSTGLTPRAIRNDVPAN